MMTTGIGPYAFYLRTSIAGSVPTWVSLSAPCRDTALHDASSKGHTESVKALLEKGADVNAENKDKCAFSCLMGDRCTRRQRLCAGSARG